MRIAVLADVHANLPALEAVLDDIARVGADRVIVNGDSVNRGPSNVEVLERLRPFLDDATLGNHDDLMAIVLERRSELGEPWFVDPFWASTRIAAEQVDQAGWLDRLKRLPMTLRITLDGAPSVLISHGSPRHYREGYGRNLTPELISEITEAHPADVLIGSHTHRALLMRWGRYTVLNTGAVGASFDGDARAHYLVLELKDGAWRPEFRRVPYDLERALEAYGDSGFLAGGGLSARIFHEELRHARSYMVPFLMWCEEQGREHGEADWAEFRDRFEARFRPPERPDDVRVSAEP
ncbi:MAG: metallophosphoesterase family protein [Trueperaceae bacterium]